MNNDDQKIEESPPPEEVENILKWFLYIKKHPVKAIVIIFILTLVWLISVGKLTDIYQWISCIIDPMSCSMDKPM
jgi:hypothetical protein